MVKPIVVDKVLSFIMLSFPMASNILLEEAHEDVPVYSHKVREDKDKDHKLEKSHCVLQQ